MGARLVWGRREGEERGGLQGRGPRLGRKVLGGRGGGGDQRGRCEGNEELELLEGGGREDVGKVGAVGVGGEQVGGG